MRLRRALNVGGLMNVQYAVKDGDIYILEVNPRASRTVPFVAKAIGTPIAKIAAKVMAGARLSEFRLAKRQLDQISVKEAVFPFARFPNVDTLLGPEMKSTGEVMGIDAAFPLAFAKSQIAGGTMLPSRRNRLRFGQRRRQAAHRRCGQASGRAWFSDHCNGRHAALSGRPKHPLRQGQQGA